MNRFLGYGAAPGLLLLLPLFVGFSGPDLSDYIPSARIRLEHITVNPPEQLFNRLQAVDAKTVLGLSNHVYTTGFKRFFVRVDRNQNWYLWPLSHGVTRSPPSLELL